MTWFKDENLLDVLYKTASIEDEAPDRFSSTNRMDIVRRGLSTAGVLSGNRHLVRGSLALRPAKAALREKELRKQSLKARGIKPEDIPQPIVGQTKVAGLFMRPSDLADHRNLSSVLENALSSSDQSKNFKKYASPIPTSHRVIGAVVGATAAGTAEYLRRQYVGEQDREIPPPLPVQGTIPQRVRATVHNAKNEAEAWTRKHPMSTLMAATASGAVLGAIGPLPSAINSLATTLKNAPPKV